MLSQVAIGLFPVFGLAQKGPPSLPARSGPCIEFES